MTDNELVAAVPSREDLEEEFKHIDMIHWEPFKEGLDDETLSYNLKLSACCMYARLDLYEKEGRITLPTSLCDKALLCWLKIFKTDGEGVALHPCPKNNIMRIMGPHGENAYHSFNIEITADPDAPTKFTKSILNFMSDDLCTPRTVEEISSSIEDFDFQAAQDWLDDCSDVLEIAKSGSFLHRSMAEKCGIELPDTPWSSVGGWIDDSGMPDFLKRAYAMDVMCTVNR